MMHYITRLNCVSPFIVLAPRDTEHKLRIINRSNLIIFNSLKPNTNQHKLEFFNLPTWLISLIKKVRSKN